MFFPDPMEMELLKVDGRMDEKKDRDAGQSLVSS
jgi:hypothetical protein